MGAVAGDGCKVAEGEVQVERRFFEVLALIRKGWLAGLYRRAEPWSGEGLGKGRQGLLGERWGWTRGEREGGGKREGGRVERKGGSSGREITAAPILPQPA